MPLAARDGAVFPEHRAFLGKEWFAGLVEWLSIGLQI